jgi:alkanesulfonate monooxygenase SsuD/methylene tetrahydromethanopterin reductase-like flavin-dependent oxidoreductase (luciferase family)
MPIGIMHQMWAEPERTDLDVLAQADTDVHLAEELGFDSFMFGEHHFKRGSAFYGRVPTPELMIASLSATTSSIMLGTGVKVLALDLAAWRSAETLLLLDLIAGGRSFFCLGQGTTASTFPAGTTDDQRRAIFRERLAELLGILRGGTAGYADEPLSLIPIRDITPRLWVAARDSETVAMAAAEGLNFVVGQAEHETVQRRYIQKYREAGGQGATRGVRIVCVAETEHAAIEAATPAVQTYFSQMSKGPYFRQATAAGLFPDRAPASVAEAAQWMSFCVGTPEAVADQLRRYQEVTGVDQFDVMVHLPGLSPTAVHRSMRLFVTEVAPAFGATVGAP